MTGEITLRGRIMRVGGLKENTKAAMRAGVKTVIIPMENEPDLDEIDQTVRQSLNFITTDNIDSILDIVMDFKTASKAMPKKKPLRTAVPMPVTETEMPSTGTSIKHEGLGCRGHRLRCPETADYAETTGLI
jgi:ATP-dependent Lon protease